MESRIWGFCTLGYKKLKEQSLPMMEKTPNNRKFRIFFFKLTRELRLQGKQQVENLKDMPIGTEGT